MQRALKDFKKAYTLSPNHPYIQNKMRELGLLGQAAPSQADFQAGQAAYKRGDYETALREWRPLADQGDPVAQSNLGGVCICPVPVQNSE